MLMSHRNTGRQKAGGLLPHILNATSIVTTNSVSCALRVDHVCSPAMPIEILHSAFPPTQFDGVSSVASRTPFGATSTKTAKEAAPIGDGHRSAGKPRDGDGHRRGWRGRPLRPVKDMDSVLNLQLFKVEPSKPPPGQAGLPLTAAAGAPASASGRGGHPLPGEPPHRAGGGKHGAARGGERRRVRIDRAMRDGHHHAHHAAHHGLPQPGGASGDPPTGGGGDRSREKTLQALMEVS